jgi:hypothetical protein
MQNRSIVIGLMGLVVVFAATGSAAGATTASTAASLERPIPIESGASDANEGFGYLDLRSAHLRVNADTASVRLTTYQRWRAGWLKQCTDSFFAVGWPDDGLQIDIDKRGDHLLRAIIRKTDRPNHVVGRVRAILDHPRALTFSFSAAKLQSPNGKWFAFSTSPSDAGCRGQWFADRIPDNGFVVP